MSAAVAGLLASLLVSAGAIPTASQASAAGSHASAAGSTTTTTSNPWVPGVNGTLTVGIDSSPTGCNPNTASGDTWADRFVLGPVLPSAFVVNGSDQAVYDAATITQAELQSTSPQTVVYTINPKAVWSDGKPITAADFVYTWEQERGQLGSLGTTPAPATAHGTAHGAVPLPTTATGGPGGPGVTNALPGATGPTGPALGYRQIKSVKGSAKGRTVTVVFKTPYADWQSLFDYLLPAHVLEKTGWDPSCTGIDPSVDLSGGPFEIAKVSPGEIVLDRNPGWWEQPPPLARVVVRIASGPAQLAEWLASGTIDVALPSGYDASYLEAMSSQPSLQSQVQLTSTFLELELSTTSSATASVDVRMAISHGIDRQSLIDQEVGWTDSAIVPGASFLYSQSQGGYPGHKPPPPQVSGQPGYTSTTTSASPTSTPFPAVADPGATTHLLSSLGYYKLADGDWQLPDGKPFVLRMAVDDADSWAGAAAPLIVRELSAVGIRVVEVQASTAEAAGADLSGGRADMALIPMHSSPYSSQAFAWYTPLLGAPGTGGSQDWSNLDAAPLNSLVEKASQQLNPVDAAPLYAEVDTVLWQDMPGLPLFTQPSVLTWSGMTSGVSPNPYGPWLLESAGSWATRVPPTSPDTEGT